MFQELGAGVVDLGDGGVRLERPLSGNLPREVLASIEEFEETTDGVDIFADEVDLTGLYYTSH